MRSTEPTIKDINVELEPLVIPENLLCGEVSLEEEEEEQEEQAQSPYRVVTQCKHCSKQLCVYVVATDVGIRIFEHVLCGDLDLVCPTCGRQQHRHGGQRQ
ncbi:E7 [Gammapapillomavirus 6]|uniref:Protein E7 n=2 Tax=Papillomaviridae TaxID=151340 RepID=A0A2D2ALD5_9PAPI|nr:E7 [Gammapapillomavirus 6]WBM83791.1 E7 protein [human papillomavirus 214]CAD1814231.1 E7 protein [Human papillomavirus type 214]